MQNWWWLVLLAMGAGVFVCFRLLADPAIRLAVDTRLLKMPLLGRLLRDVAVARFTRTLATLSSAGVPILTALRVTRGTLGNKALERVIDQVCEQVSGGKTIADPMERSGYFPPMLVQIVSIGERSGRLDQMLSQAASAFEEKTESSVKRFTTALPPLLVVVMACAVGFMVLAILLPIIEMQGAIK
jgi:general secretion pathway protein F